MFDKLKQLEIRGPKSLLYFILAVGTPLVVRNQYILHIAILLGVYLMLGLSLNMVTGFAGELDLGHAAFFGIGAYTSSLLVLRLIPNFWVGFAAAILSGFVFGLLLGIPALRIRGDYLAIVTMGFNEIIRYVLLNWQELTNGPLGVSAIPSPRLGPWPAGHKQAMFYLIATLVFLTYALTKNISSSRFGRALVAIRENEIAATSLGINIGFYNTISFAISAALAGAAGSFFAHYMSFINPNNFTTNESILILCMVVIGGKGSLLGSVVGVSTLFLLPEILRPVEKYRMLLYGILLVVMMVYRSNGFIPEKRIPKPIGHQKSAGRDLP